MGKKTKLGFAISLLLAVMLIVVALLRHLIGEGVSVSHMADGSTYRLVHVAFTNSFSYTQNSAPSFLRPFLPFIPDSLRQRFFRSRGSIGVGGTTETNLMLVMEASNLSATSTRHNILRIRDDQGNAFDGTTANGVLSVRPGASSALHIASVTPNRSKLLLVEPLEILPDGTWTNLGPFSVTNPKYGDYPQWTPDPVPQPRDDGDLTAILQRFETGPGSGAIALNDPVSIASPQSTRMEFDLIESGLPTDHFRLHHITLNDATGNKWSPHLSTNTSSRFGWITGGRTEFRGGLWPGEDAWKIDLQVIRTAGFDAADIWEVPVIRMPEQNEFVEPNTSFELDDLNATIANILAPGVQVTNRWQWTVRYWGNESSVYPIGMECLNMGNQRPVILEARNENGTDFRIINHQSVDHPMQCIFVQPPDEGATELHLRFAFPELKNFQYIARPAFIDPADVSNDL